MSLLRPVRFARGLAALAVTAAAVVAAAQSQAAGAAEARSLVCEFAAGQSTSYEAGRFATRPPAPLNFLVVDIDLDRQSARISTGDAGTMGNLKIVRALNANHFIEVLNEGFLTLTTIYDIENPDGSHPAAHSRHMGVLGQPVVAHYVGTCRGK